MKTVKDVFSEYRNTLNGLYDVNEAEAITLLAVSEITGFSRAKIKAFPELQLSEQQINTLDHILNQLKTGKPIQYILGKTEFHGLPFNVNPSVLIPRPETEELVAWIIEAIGSGELVMGSDELAVGRILDIGTGSGCIAISLKKNLPGFEVSAMDISASALETAKGNALLNEVEINFIEADVLNHNALSHISQLISHISIIVSNPPYVTQHDKTQMHINVMDFEPHNALFVPQDDPLIFYKAISDFAIKNLVQGGMLFFEINENYGAKIVELLTHKSFNNIELRKDMSGRDRMVKADR